MSVDKTEVEQMNAIFDRFISSSEITPTEITKTDEIIENSNEVDNLDNLVSPNTVHKHNVDLFDDQPDLNNSISTNTITRTRFPQNQALLELSSENQVPVEPSSNRTKLPEKQLSNFYLIPNSLHDEFLPTLPPYEQLVFLRLYRLSIGFNKTLTDPVSYSKLAAKCNLSVSTVKRALQALEAKKLIKVLGEAKHNPMSGNQYELLIKMVPIELSSIRTKFSQTSIKEDDDPLKRQDHHQSEHEKNVMMIYQTVTQNSWTKADIATYQKVKNVPIDKIEIAIRLATQRASSRPNSLAFFTKEILSVTSPKTNRSKQKKAMQKIIEQIKNSKVGSSYSISDLSYWVKEACLRNDITYDTNLFDELTT